jgi:hypothetical protein
MRYVIAILFFLIGSTATLAQQCTSNNQCAAGRRCTLDKLVPTTDCDFFIFCDTYNLEVKSCRRTCVTNANCPSNRCRCPMNQPASSCNAARRACY